MSAPTTQAGTVPEDEKPVGWQLYLKPLERWGRMINTKEMADEAIAGYPASGVPSARPLYAHPDRSTRDTETAALRAELERAHQRIESLASDASGLMADLSTAEQQLSELRAEMETVRGERDDARKALEAVQTKVAVLDELLTAKDVWFDYGSGFRAHFSFDAGTDWPWQADLHGLHAAARSASREGVR